MSYYVVVNLNTGENVCQCALLEDAQMMVALNPVNRAYRKVTPLNDAVIDVESIVENALPGQIGLPPGSYKIEGQKIYKLPENQQIPFNGL
jgi:hypothetical protein